MAFSPHPVVIRHHSPHGTSAVDDATAPPPGRRVPAYPLRRQRRPQDASQDPRPRRPGWADNQTSRKSALVARAQHPARSLGHPTRVLATNHCTRVLNQRRLHSGRGRTHRNTTTLEASRPGCLPRAVHSRACELRHRPLRPSCGFCFVAALRCFLGSDLRVCAPTQIVTSASILCAALQNALAMTTPLTKRQLVAVWQEGRAWRLRPGSGALGSPHSSSQTVASQGPAFQHRPHPRQLQRPTQQPGSRPPVQRLITPGNQVAPNPEALNAKNNCIITLQAYAEDNLTCKHRWETERQCRPKPHDYLSSGIWPTGGPRSSSTNSAGTSSVQDHCLAPSGQTPPPPTTRATHCSTTTHFCIEFRRSLVLWRVPWSTLPAPSPQRPNAGHNCAVDASTHSATTSPLSRAGQSRKPKTRSTTAAVRANGAQVGKETTVAALARQGPDGRRHEATSVIAVGPVYAPNPVLLDLTLTDTTTTGNVPNTINPLFNPALKRKTKRYGPRVHTIALTTGGKMHPPSFASLQHVAAAIRPRPSHLLNTTVALDPGRRAMDHRRTRLAAGKTLLLWPPSRTRSR